MWLWGVHPVDAGLKNPSRTILDGRITRNAAIKLELDPDHPPTPFRLVEPREIDDMLPPGAVHQGVAVRARELDGDTLEGVILGRQGPLVILDQVTDPQNVGAVFRSAAAFGAKGVVMQTRKSPPLSGALAKAAVGAIETVPEIPAVNIARAVDALAEAGWWVVGLDGESETSLREAFETPAPIAIVLGAEGPGMRPAVAKACSQLARIPMSPDMESLNVSNAAAIALYEAFVRHS